MPYGTSVLSSHILFSEYRGPRILNELDPTPAPAPTPDPKPDPKPDPVPAPKPDPKDTEGRISTLAREKKELEDKLAKREADDKAAAETKLKEEGKLQELLTAKEKELADLNGSSTSMKAKLDAYEKLATEQIAASIKAIGDKEKQKTVTDMLDRDLERQ